MLETGLGCDEDPEGAFNWYAEAANMDYAKAQNAIGSCYYKGFGHDQNFELAIKWFRLSAEQVKEEMDEGRRGELSLIFFYFSLP